MLREGCGQLAEGPLCAWREDDGDDGVHSQLVRGRSQDAAQQLLVSSRPARARQASASEHRRS